MDASGIHSVVQVKDELTKNRRENNEAEEGGYMFEKIGDPLVLLHHLKSMYQNKILIAVHFFSNQKK